MTDVVTVAPASALRGRLRVPGDKSTSHRALMIAALAKGESRIAGLSPGLDVASTAIIMGQLGASIATVENYVVVEGPEHGLRPSTHALDCGNSGTTMRLVCGLVSAVEGQHELTGDPSLSARPMDRVAVPLRMMGADVQGQGDRVTAPLRIRGSAPLRAIEYRVPHASAQVKSAILLAGLSADAATVVHEHVRTRSTTETMLRDAGITVDTVDVDAGRRVTLQPGRPRAHSWFVPGDPSQAAFFCVLATLHHDAQIEIDDIDAAPERTGFVGVLQRMGASIMIEAGDGVVRVRVSSAALRGTEIHAHEIPSVDEVPVLVVAAAAAKGKSAFRDMGELRIKESDRFAGSLGLAAALGCRVWSEGDDFFVEGLESARGFNSFEIDAGLDHRMVMASAVAGAVGSGCTIMGPSTVSSSYPMFFDDLASLQ